MPLEPIWDSMFHDQSDYFVRSDHELFDAIVQFFNAVTQVPELVLSLPNKLKRVIQINGELDILECRKPLSDDLLFQLDSSYGLLLVNHFYALLMRKNDLLLPKNMRNSPKKIGTMYCLPTNPNLSCLGTIIEFMSEEGKIRNSKLPAQCPQ